MSRKPSAEEVFWYQEEGRQRRQSKRQETVDDTLHRRLSAGFAALNGEGVYSEEDEDDGDD